MRRPIDRKTFDRLVAVLQTGRILLDGGEADMSPDQTIRIHNGQLEFSPPLKVKKSVELLNGWLGSIRVGSAIAEIVFRAETDTIYMDLIGSPVDLELYPQDTNQPQPLMLTMPSQASLVMQVTESWEEISEACLNEFGCHSAAVSATTSKSHQAHLRKRQESIERTVAAVRKVTEENPQVTSPELYSSVAAVLFPLLFRLFGEVLLSMLQRAVIDWLLNRKQKSSEPAGAFADVAFSLPTN